MVKLKIKAVLFDLDDTLCNTSMTKPYVFGKIYDENPKFKNLRRNEFINFCMDERLSYLKKANSYQSFSRINFWLKIVNHCKAEMKVDELKNIIDSYWEYTLEKLMLFENVEETLVELNKKGIVTCVLASSDFYTKAQKIIKLGLKDDFRYIFTSDLLDLPKNDPAIYAYVADFLKVEPSEIVMVGDEAEMDIIPAKKAGLNTALAMMKGATFIDDNLNSTPNFILYKILDLFDFIAI